ncbi:RHS repeat domain-containing protein [Streptomyces sp. NPDC088725]|uniref:RHS repeat domain-containing protein n=1 Tax=Streptomyces sp. NPDC088725 TaxID=3365873 RepID=UPI0038294CFA
MGRPLGVTAGDWTERYTYDSAGNQTSARWPGRARDTQGGERTYSGTRLVGADGLRYEYDDAGRVVLRQKQRLSRKPETWRYTWDAEDRLESCTTPDGTEWRYTYDALGRRTAKHRMTADGHAVAATVRFAWDGTQLAEETDTATGVTLTWEYEGPQPMSQLERRLPADTGQQEVDSRFFAIVTDVIGAPTELVDEQGDIAWHKRSTVWGVTSRNRDARALTPLRFPGQYADQETGLHDNLNRHYDPETARYMSADPHGLVPAPNPAAYVVNPFTWMDPEGLIAKGCTQEGGWYGGCCRRTGWRAEASIRRRWRSTTSRPRQPARTSLSLASISRTSRTRCRWSTMVLLFAWSTRSTESSTAPGPRRSPWRGISGSAS